MSILIYNSNQMHKSQSLFNLTTALHVSGVTITHLQEHKTTVTTASGNRYTVIDRVKFSDEEYRQTRLKLQLLNNVYSAENAISSIEQQQTTVRVRTSFIILQNLSHFPAEYTLFNNCNFNLVYRYSLSVNLTVSITV